MLLTACDGASTTNSPPGAAVSHPGRRLKLRCTLQEIAEMQGSMKRGDESGAVRSQSLTCRSTAARHRSPDPGLSSQARLSATAGRGAGELAQAEIRLHKVSGKPLMSGCRQRLAAPDGLHSAHEHCAIFHATQMRAAITQASLDRMARVHVGGECALIYVGHNGG